MTDELSPKEIERRRLASQKKPATPSHPQTELKGKGPKGAKLAKQRIIRHQGR